MQCDYWIEQYVPPMSKVGFLDFYKENSYNESDSLTVHFELYDHSNISEHANFSMHPFEVNYDNFKTMALSNITSLSLGKLYRHVDYHINVMTPITEKDTLWIGNESTKLYPAGDDIGCRLEVHDYRHLSGSASLIRLLGDYYLEEKQIEVQKLIQVLYRRKIVVVELCGC